MKDALQAGFRIRRIEQLSAVPRFEPSTSAKEIILDLSDRLSAINSITKKLQSAPNAQVSDTTGDHSSNVAAKQSTPNKDKEGIDLVELEKRIDEVLASETEESFNEFLKKKGYVKPDKEGIDVASDSNPDQL